MQKKENPAGRRTCFPPPGRVCDNRPSLGSAEFPVDEANRQPCVGRFDAHLRTLAADPLRQWFRQDLGNLHCGCRGHLNFLNMKQSPSPGKHPRGLCCGRSVVSFLKQMNPFEPLFGPGSHVQIGHSTLPSPYYPQGDYSV